MAELLQHHGFSFDQKPLKPHLTIARVKKNDHPSAFQWLLTKYQETVSDSIDVNKIALFESISTPNGPVYKPLYVKQLIR